MGNRQRFSILKDKACLYAYLPERRSQFRSTTFSREKFYSSSGGDHVAGGYILETPSYFVLPPWYIKPPKTVLDLVHLKKDHTDASVYQQLFMEIRDRYRDHIPVDTDGSRDGLCYSFSIKHRNFYEIA